jgi:hypothetical protein
MLLHECFYAFVYFHNVMFFTHGLSDGAVVKQKTVNHRCLYNTRVEDRRLKDILDMLFSTCSLL